MEKIRKRIGPAILLFIILIIPVTGCSTYTKENPGDTLKKPTVDTDSLENQPADNNVMVDLENEVDELQRIIDSMDEIEKGDLNF